MSVVDRSGQAVALPRHTRRGRRNPDVAKARMILVFKALLDGKLSYRDIAREVNKSVSTVYYYTRPNWLKWARDTLRQHVRGVAPDAD